MERLDLGGEFPEEGQGLFRLNVEGSIRQNEVRAKSGKDVPFDGQIARLKAFAGRFRER
jgi:hypothetical protein